MRIYGVENRLALLWQVCCRHGTSTYNVPCFLFSLNASQHRRYAAFASGRVSWVEALAVVAVSDIDPLVSSDWVRINNWRWMNAVFPLLLHLCMHNQENCVADGWQLALRRLLVGP